MKTLCKLLPLLLVLSLCLTGCRAEPKTFTSKGVQLTLTDAFEPYDASGFDFAYASERVMVVATEDTKNDLTQLGFSTSDQTTAADYLNFVIKQNQMEGVTPLQKDGLDYINYTADVDGTTFKYFSVVLRQGTTFWFIQFACREKEYDKNEETFVSWAKAITFVER